MTARAVRPMAIKIDEDIKDRIKRLEREEKREAFWHYTFRAWEAFRLTGQHATAHEADAWMSQLEQGHDIEPPECHA